MYEREKATRCHIGSVVAAPELFFLLQLGRRLRGDKWVINIAILCNPRYRMMDVPWMPSPSLRDQP